jgi:hypothetical protein
MVAVAGDVVDEKGTSLSMASVYNIPTVKTVPVIEVATISVVVIFRCCGIVKESQFLADEEGARYKSFLFASGRLETERQEVRRNDRPSVHLEVKALTITR